jgi:hypothetical protein
MLADTLSFENLIGMMQKSSTLNLDTFKVIFGAWSKSYTRKVESPVLSVDRDTITPQTPRPD